MNGTRNKTKKVKEEAFPAFPGSKKRDVQKADEEERDNVTGYLRLPLELLSLIGQFVLGDDNYATLANFSLTSRLLREELLPMLYETVVLNEKDSRWFAVVSGNAMTRKPSKFTKYLIADLSSARTFLVGRALDLGPNGQGHRRRRLSLVAALQYLTKQSIRLAYLREPLSQEPDEILLEFHGMAEDGYQRITHADVSRPHPDRFSPW